MKRARLPKQTDDLYVKEFGGIKCWLRPNSSDEVVFDDNIKRAPVTQHLTINPGQRWLDLGGYIGTFALFIKSRGGSVVSVEANPVNAQMYERNMGLNNFGYELFQRAVMYEPPESGEVTLHVMPETGNRRRNHAASTMFNRWKTEYPGITVPAMKFSEAVKSAFAMLGPDGDWNLKIDIEGAEIEILMHSDLSPFNQIYWEYHFQANNDPDVPRAITERLESMGYEVFWSRKLPTKPPTMWWDQTCMGWARKRDYV